MRVLSKALDLRRGVPWNALLTLAASLSLLLASACWPSQPVERVRVTRSTHTAIFPLMSGAHKATSCEACHGEFDTFTKFSCVTCHPHEQAQIEPVHHGVPDYQFNGQDCYGCHPTGERYDRASHTVFPIKTGKHAPVACGDCHTTGKAKEVSCIDCHSHDAAVETPRHNGVPGYAFTSQRCLACHPTGQPYGADNHRPPEILKAPHGGFGCSDCHTTGTTVFSCIDCHSHDQPLTDAAHSGVANYQYQSQACFICHPDGKGGISRPDHDPYFPIRVGTNHGQTQCQGCHPVNKKSFVCFDCHSHSCAGVRPRHDEVRNFSCQDTECKRCHPRGFVQDD